MSQGKIRHLFPGGNSALGFFSYYSNIISQEDANRIIVIKGGPGVGKSTFMKRIGEEMLKNGYSIEFLHCSSDNNSLDGVKIKELNVVFIDGTAPHIVDPKSPGAVDEILNFGEFWNEQGIRANKANIINTNNEIGCIFERAYKYLKAASSIYEDSRTINNMALDKGELNLYSLHLIDEIFRDLPVSKNEGKQRSIFASAITPNGFSNYLDSLLDSENIYEIVGSLGTCEDMILQKIKSAALERGLFVEAFYCALNPYKLEHLVIPDINIALTTKNKYHFSSVDKTGSVDVAHFYNPEILEKHKDDLIQNMDEFDNMMSIALNTISKAKALHDKLETYYIPNIDFNAIDECFARTIKKITT